MQKTKGTLNCFSNVTLKVFKNNILLNTFKYHNTVTMNLFNGINSFLRGECKGPNYLYNYIPQYLGVSPTAPSSGYNINSNYLVDEMNIPRLKLTNNPSDVKNGVLVIPYNTTIPYKSIGSTSIQSLGLFGIPQFRGDSNNQDQILLAGVVLDTPISIAAGSSILVEWDINLQAVTETTSGGNN